ALNAERRMPRCSCHRSRNRRSVRRNRLLNSQFESELVARPDGGCERGSVDSAQERLVTPVRLTVYSDAELLLIRLHRAPHTAGEFDLPLQCGHRGKTGKTRKRASGVAPPSGAGTEDFEVVGRGQRSIPPQERGAAEAV